MLEVMLKSNSVWKTGGGDDLLMKIRTVLRRRRVCDNVKCWQICEIACV